MAMNRTVYRELRGAQMEERQAEIIASHIPDWSQFATKQDLAELKAELKSEFKQDVAELKSDLMRWQWVQMVPSWPCWPPCGSFLSPDRGHRRRFWFEQGGMPYRRRKAAVRAGRLLLRPRGVQTRGEPAPYACIRVANGVTNPKRQVLRKIGQ